MTSTTDVYILGKNICLRDWISADVKVFEKWNKPGNQWQDLDGPYYRSAEDESSKLANALRLKIQSKSYDSPRSRLVVANISSNKLLGTVSSYWESKETNWLCIGITLYDPAFWGKGVGYEALKLWIDYLFLNHPNIVRLDMRTWSGNLGMMKLATKLGFKQEACFRKARIVNGTYFDGLGYGILREEWTKEA